MSQHRAGDAAPHEDHEMTYGDVFSGEEKPFWNIFFYPCTVFKDVRQVNTEAVNSRLLTPAGKPQITSSEAFLAVYKEGKLKLR